MTVEHSPEIQTFINDSDVLCHLSKYFDVKETIYGGRGCFASDAIPKGTVLLECNGPISSSIIRPFRKEVCTYCYSYFDGKTLKNKLGSTDKQYKDIYLYFCTEKCKSKFESDDIDHLYLNSLLTIEKYYINGLKKKEMEIENPKGNLQSKIKTEWEKVTIWEKKINEMKPSKKLTFVPRITDSEYMEIKYVIGVLFQLYKYKALELEKVFFKDASGSTLASFELKLFDLLQSSEEQKVQKYPYLLYSYINIYKFIKLTTHTLLQPFISSQHVRDIIGKNLSNAFGIWSIQVDNEDKEFFGFGVYPSASYFNHSCSPNLIKKRIENKLTFTTIRDIKKDEELCIDYGNYLNESVEVRKKELNEWFFDCGCEKCNLESSTT